MIFSTFKMPDKPAEKEMSFIDHLEELRKRLLKSILAVGILAIAAYFISDRLVDTITLPLRDVGVYFKAPTEAFMVRIKISLFAGAVAAAPVVFYQLWMFIAPGLLRKEIKLIVAIVLSATVFFLAGGAFCFFLVVPVAVRLLLSFATENMKPMIMIGDYISFVGMLVLAFGAVFELPVASFILGRLGVINDKTLRKGRRYAVVIILIAAAILTPTPDAFSQLMLAGPLYILYEVSIIVVRLTGKRKAE